MPSGDDIFTVHARECGECLAADPPVGEIAERLAAGAPATDAADWSRGVLLRARPELAARARAVFWRRMVRVLGAALMPLPLIVVADLWWLGRVYELASAWLPVGLAMDLVASYGATLLALLGSAYAAIPLLLASRSRSGRAEPSAA